MYSNDLICDILEFIDNNFKRDISIEEISLKFSYNRYYIMKKFKKEIGDSIISYINKLRVYNSLSELNHSNNSIVLISINTYSSFLIDILHQFLIRCYHNLPLPKHSFYLKKLINLFLLIIL